MKKLKFNKISAYNFLCFGPEGIEIKFEDYGQIVFIRGENRDVKETEDDLSSDEVKISSNGSGKSSLQEIISYGLYGKTVKKPSAISKDAVINNLIGKDCKIELQWDKYKLVRTRKKNSLRFWENETLTFDDASELTTGSMDETQKIIEDAIGLTYEAFVNICIFSDDQSVSFLEASTPVKREIVENLLSLCSYREKQEKAKKLTSETSASIKMMCKEYDIFKNNEQDANQRLEQTKNKDSSWKLEKENEIKNLKVQIDAKKEKLGNSTHGDELLAYREAQNKIISHNENINELEKIIEDEKGKIIVAKSKEDKVKELAQDVRNKSDAIKLEISNRQQKIKNKKNHIQSLQNHEHGTTCDHCYGVIDEKNILHVINSEEKEISSYNQELQICVSEAEKITTEAKDVCDKQVKIKDFISMKEKVVEANNVQIRSLRNLISDLLKIKEPKADSYELLLNQQIEQLEVSLREKTNEYKSKSPYEDLILSYEDSCEKAKISCKEKQDNIKEAEDNLKYYQYWQFGFGEKGIRKTVVDGIIPELNNRISYWLQFLIDNKISLRFDNEFNEIIERSPVDGDPYVYHAMSAGQRRRLNLAVSQAFADVMMISSGTIPSLVFLDEVTTNIDPLGVQGIYNMIQELSADKQVFITTHDKDLIKMLETVQTINLIHQNGFTKLKK